MPNFRKLNKGGAGYGSLTADDLAFLKADNSDQWQASASRVGVSGRYDDDAGTRDLTGFGVDGSDDNAAFLDGDSWSGDRDAPHTRLGVLIDGQRDQPAGDLLGGGGPVSRNKVGGVGPGTPRYAPKNIGTKAIHSNMRGGTSRHGHGRGR